MTTYTAYHGSPNSTRFDSFDNDMLGSNTDAASAAIGFYFSSRRVAEIFRGNGIKLDTGQLYKAEIDFNNPYIISATKFHEMIFGDNKRADILADLVRDIADDFGAPVYPSYSDHLEFINDDTGQTEPLGDDDLSGAGAKLYNKYLEIMSLDPRDMYDGRKFGYNDDDWASFKEDLVNNGFDGIIVDADDYDSGEWDIPAADELLDDNYIVFDACQIRIIND